MAVVTSFESHAKDFCQEFLGAEISRRYLLGRNDYSSALAARVEIAGFVDDWAQESTHQGKPIVRASDLDPDALVVSCSVGIRPTSARARLRALGLRNLDYFAFRRFSGLELPQVSLLQGCDELGDVSSEIAWLRSRLDDAVSRQTLQKIADFRDSYDLDHLEGFTDRQDEQYFEGLAEILADSEHVFVDAGCFDGATSRQFITLCPNYRHVYALEPLPASMVAVKQTLSGCRDVTYLAKGLYSSYQELSFQSGGSASSISDDGDITIEVDRLDALVEQKVTFIKMDIEGAELEAIEGCRQRILSDHPMMALCVYHRPCDLWTVPRKVLSIRTDYTVHLRHYTEGVTETVMYFIPHGTLSNGLADG